MKKKLLASCLLLLCFITGFSQKFYVTVGSLGAPDAKAQQVKASRSDMLRTPSLTVHPNIGIIESFVISYLPNKGEYVGPLFIKGAEIPAEPRSWIEHCSRGDKFYFEEIKVWRSDSTKALVNGEHFTVLIN